MTQQVPLDVEISCPRCGAPMLVANQTEFGARLVVGKSGTMIEASATWIVPRHRCEDLPS